MKRFLSFSICIFSVCTLCAQMSDQLTFWQYSLKEGLSQSTVYDISQDALGYLWATTDDGLNCFDGYEFTVYRHNRADSTSLVSSFTRSLFNDVDGNLWIGTQNGLSCYDRLHKRFRNFPYAVETAKEKMTVFGIEQFKDAFLLATDKGLFRFSEFEGYKSLGYQQVRVMDVKKFRHHILFGADNGLFFYFPESDSYELVDESFRGLPVLVLEPHAKDRNKIWVGTEGSGLFLLDVAQKKVVSYRHQKGESSSLSSDYVRSLCYDEQQRLWVGTFVGLNISSVDGVFDRHFYDPEKSGEISQNSIRSIFRDSQGGMWCGTYFGGLNYYHPMRNRFQHIYSRLFVNSVNDNVISVMLSDEANNLWIGTNDNGLNYYDDRTGQFSSYSKRESDPSSIPGNNVKALLRKYDGNLYVGMHGGGLALFSKATGQFSVPAFAEKMQHVYSLLYDSEGHLWVGTLAGLYVFDDRTGKRLDYPALAERQILCLYADASGLIWIGTDTGIFLYSEQAHNLQEVNPAVENYRKVNCFTEDKNGNIWIGTREGLLCYDRNARMLIDMHEKINFPEMVIYGILEDNFSQLWISTNSGLVCLNKLTSQWRVYTEKDGIQSNQFNVYSYCKNLRGKMYFGGINGITAFYPERLLDNPFAPAPIIGRLTVFGREILPDDGTNILSKSIDRTEKLKLHAQQAVFGLDLVVPNFLSGGKNTFAYKFDGIDDEWTYTTDNRISFSHLPVGKYKLLIRAANNDGKWSEQITTLQIEILPEWWRTWWALLIFSIVILALVILGVNVYTSRKLMERRLEMERNEKERNHELNEAKIRFFINIAHEFKTPLTLMLSPLQEILRMGIPNRWMRSQLEYIMRNCKRLLGLVNQTLDYRRSELGVLELSVAYQPLNLFLREIFDMFSKLAEKGSINYNYVGLPDDDTQVYYDANYVERILSNLISNAFKYTPQGGSIEVVAELRQGMLVLQVHDTGCGISPENVDKIFDRFYQVEENTKGTGIGLSLVQSLVKHYHGEITVRSRLGEGSVFTVTLPCEESAFLPTELAKGNAQYVSIIDRMYTENDLDTSAKADKTASDETPISDDLAKEKHRIMIVDDDEDVRSYLKENFAEEYVVEAYVNGREAWDRLNESPDFDLIISDVMMPEMDGTKLCKLLKQNISFCHIPIFLLTAKSDVSAQVDALSLGADDYIAKPFVYSVLRSKVRNLFKSQQRILQHYATAHESNVAELVNNPLDEKFLQKAISIIEKNMENPEFSTEDFSSAMAMSRSNLYLKLKALTGESAVEFIRRIRFSYACKLLKEGRYNVSEISTMIGFTPSYFATSFKKYMGCLPSEYQKKK